MTPHPFIDWRPSRLERRLASIAKNIGGIMLAGLLVLAFAYFGGRA